MLAWCLMITRRETSAMTCAYCMSLVNIQTAIGAETAWAMPPTDEIRVSPAATIQTATAESPACQESANVTPSEVATALPPRNPSQTETCGRERRRVWR